VARSSPPCQAVRVRGIVAHRVVRPAAALVPRTRRNMNEFTRTTAERHLRRWAGQAAGPRPSHLLNRRSALLSADTVHCLTEDEGPIGKNALLPRSGHDSRKYEVRSWLIALATAGVRKRPAPSRYYFSRCPGHWATYLPRYAGNLDIMTAARPCSTLAADAGGGDPPSKKKKSARFRIATRLGGEGGSMNPAGQSGCCCTTIVGAKTECTPNNTKYPL